MEQTLTFLCSFNCIYCHSRNRCKDYLKLFLFNNLLIGFSAISFMVYGSSIFFSKAMKLEFIRFGLEKFSRLIGCLEICGGLGLIFGLWAPPLLVLSSLGLFLLMLLGFGVRLKMGDSFMLSFPSFFYMFLNFYIFYFIGLANL